MKKPLKLLISVLFCLVCVAVPTGLFWFSRTPGTVAELPFTHEETEFFLPEVLYLSEQEAVQTLTALGLKVTESGKTHNPVIPENQVVTQSPPAGSLVHTGDTISLHFSDGWKEYVPDLINLKEETAVEKLKALGFEVECREQFSEIYAPGTVISQSFSADTRIRIGTTVQITISKGNAHTDPAKTEIVGDYVHMDFQEAQKQLAELQLYALQTDTVYDPDIPNGTVISQDIAPGTPVAQGTSISMKVSLGQITAHVPDCAGQNITDARKLLEDAGFVCMTTYIPTSDYPLDTVISQNQPAEMSLAVGSQVWLTVSVGSSSYVVSHGGWSGNPLPSFTSAPETTETETELIIEPLITDIPEELPEIPEVPEIPEIPVTAPPQEIPETPETTTTTSDYEDAPETAPF